MMKDQTQAGNGNGNTALKWAAGLLVVAVGLAIFMRPQVAVAPQTDVANAPSGPLAPATSDTQDPGFGDAAEPDVADGDPAEESPDAAETNVAIGDTDDTAPMRPTIDTVRLEADGVLVVAGRATAGATVGLLVDGDEVGSSVANGQGSFAAVAFLEPVSYAQVLTLRVNGQTGELASLDEVILAPQNGTGEDVAQADVATAPAAGDQDPEVQNDQDKTVDVAVAQVSQAANLARTEETGQSAQDGQLPGTDNVDIAAGTPASDEVASQPAGRATDTDQTQRASGSDDADANQAVARSTELSEGQAPSSEPPAQQEVALLKSNEQGVTLLQPRLTTPDTIALDTIGYSDSGVVQLSGRASEEAEEVRVYLNNRPVARLRLDAAGGWRGEVPDVETGVYTLRVDAVDGAGVVTSRVETPFKREEPAVLAAAGGAGTGLVSAVTVQAGDTLWAIARERYGEGLLYVRVFDANRSAIRNPDLIYPGQVFDLPGD